VLTLKLEKKQVFYVPSGVITTAEIFGFGIRKPAVAVGRIWSILCKAENRH